MTKLLLKRYGETVSSPEVKAKIGKLSGTVGIIANILLALSKLAIGTLSGAVSIVADALNNLSDAISSIITLVGFRLSEQPADEKHPYGHARFEYLSALAVSVLIIFIGFELGKSSVEKIFNPSPVSLTMLSLIIFALSIPIKLFLARFNKTLGMAIDSKALIASGTDSRNDVIASGAVLVAAIVEKFFAVSVDEYVGLAVAVFILFSGISLARETVSALLGETPCAELKEEIVDYITSQPLVLGYHDLMVHDYGMGRRFASLHVEMDKDDDPFLCHELIDDMERECKKNHGVELVIHYDPVAHKDPIVNEMKGAALKILKTLDERLTLHDFRTVPGESHTNILFDAVIPDGCKITQDEIKEAVEESLSKIYNQKIYAVITYDLMAFN